MFGKGFMKRCFVVLIIAILIVTNCFVIQAKEPPENKAKAAVLLEPITGRFLYEKNSSESLPIASVTKIMSMFLIMENVDSGKLKFEDKVQVSATACGMGGSQVYLKEGEEFTVLELLKAIAIHSANDATVALAEKIAGSEEAFVSDMNLKAKELGMTKTYFLDCTGLTDEGHFSSAGDIAILSKELLLKHPTITQFTSSWHDTFRNGQFSLDNTNKLIRFYQGAIGLKTGYTSIAGFNLAAAAKRNNMLLISVILGESDSNVRFQDSKKLLDYGFANFESRLVSKKNELVSECQVKKGMYGFVNGIIPKDISFVLDKGSKLEIEKKVFFFENLKAPVMKGSRIGTMVYLHNGQQLGKSDIISDRTVEEATFGKLFSKLLREWVKI